MTDLFGYFVQEAKELFAYFDTDGKGGVDIDEFMVAFRVRNDYYQFTGT